MELADDFVRRRQAGEHPTISEYCEQHPELASEIEELFPTLVMLEKTKSSPVVETGIQTKIIGSYELIREIGRGGMGVVYQARHDSLERNVALKLLPARLADDPKAIARFQREAKAISNLHHTNIVPLYEAGIDGSHCFFAMQLINGRSLDKMLISVRNEAVDTKANKGSTTKVQNSSVNSQLASLQQLLESSESDSSSSSKSSGRSSFDWAARIGVQVADAIHYAHKQGVIHRDLKPSNIMVDENGTAWLTDFGLAKLEGDDLTQTGDIVGTLRYMSPERFVGECDSRADIYGLGLTLYELVLQRPAYQSSDRGELVRLISQADPVRPRLIAPRVPRDLETIILKSIEKEPRHRYKNAEQLKQDLQRFLNDEPVRARRISPVERSLRWARRNKAMATALSGIALMAAITIAVMAYSLTTTRTALKESRRFNAKSLLTLANDAFGERRYQTASMLAAKSMEVFPTDVAQAKLNSAVANSPASLHWSSSTPGNVGAVACGNKGALIAAANDGLIHLWNAETLESLSTLAGHAEVITALAVCSSRPLVASGSKDQTVRLWSAKTGELLWSHQVSAAPVEVSISADGKYVAAGGSFRGTVRVWNVGSGKEQCHFEGRGSAIQSLDLTSDGNWLAVCHVDNSLVVRNLQTQFELPLSVEANINALRFLDSDRLVVGTTAGCRAWQRQDDSWKPLATVYEDIHVATIAYQADSNDIAIASHDGSIHFCDAVTFEEQSTQTTEDAGPVDYLAYTQGQRLLMASAPIAGRNDDRKLRLFDPQTGSNTAWISGHGAAVRQIDFSNDGKLIASLSDDQTVRLWDGVQTTAIERWQVPGKKIDCISISPNGKWIAASAADKTVRLWRTERGKPDSIEPIRFQKRVLSLDFSPDNTTLACMTPSEVQFLRFGTATELGNLSELWRAQLLGDVDASEVAGVARLRDDTVATDDKSKRQSTLDVVKVLAPAEHPFKGNALKYSPTGDFFATGTAKGKILLWSRAGKPVGEVSLGKKSNIRSMHLSADGNRLAVLSGENPVSVYDLSDRKKPRMIRRLSPHGTGTYSMSLSPRGDRLLTGSYDNTATLWSVETGSPISQLEGQRGLVDQVHFSDDGRFSATSSQGEIRLWKMNSSTERILRASKLIDPNEKNVGDGMLFTLEWNPDKSSLMIKGLRSGTYRAVILDMESDRRQVFKYGYGGSFDPNGSRIVLCSQSGDLEVIDLDTGKRHALEHDGTPMKDVEYNCDGTLIAAGTDKKILLWDAKTFQPKKSIPARWVRKRTSIEFHPLDPTLLAHTTDDGKVEFWDVSQSAPRQIRVFDGHPGTVGRIAFSPDGRLMVSCGYGEAPSVVLWDVDTGNVLQRLMGHQDNIPQAAISPDGKWVASAGRDRTVRLWDVATGEEVRRFQDHTKDVFAVRFSGDGKQLISASADGTVRIRDLHIDAATPTFHQISQQFGLQFDEELLRPTPKRIEWRFSDL